VEESGEKKAGRVFGPVPSRRLGLSLGVDVTTFKHCSYDCIYCQLGRTTVQATERIGFFDPESIADELSGVLSSRGKVDYITFSGSGEPTLYSGLGRLAGYIKEMTDIPVAVLTNGSLLWREDVAQDLSAVDFVMPTIAAGDAGIFKFIHRPPPELTFDRVVQGISDFRQGFGGEVWLEVFLLGGINSVYADVRNIRDICNEINPAKIQLNTTTRPPAEDFAFPVKRETMIELRDYFGPRAEIISARTSYDTAGGGVAATTEDIAGMLRRRPCTAADIADSLGLKQIEVQKHLEKIHAGYRLREEKRDGSVYYYLRDTSAMGAG